MTRAGARLPRRRGRFITIEGIDGTGKTTQVRQLVAWLARRGYAPLVTREPGGTKTGNQIRGVLLASANDRLTPLAELLLMYAARHQHLEEVVRPALARGRLVVSDRFNDASFAYQGSGRKLGEAAVRRLDELVCGSTQPDLTILLDAPPRLSLTRAKGRRERGSRTRFEDAGLQFQIRVRRGYLAISRRDPQRVKLVRADRPIESVQAEIRALVSEFIERTGSK